MKSSSSSQKVSENVEERGGSGPQQNFILYKRRWIILGTFSLVSMMNEVIWISLSTISNTVQGYYDVNALMVDWLSMIYLLIFMFAIVSAFLLGKYGLKFTIVTGAFLNAVGACFRAAGWNRNGFPFVFFGSAVAAMGQSFLFFLPPHIAAVWFGEHERATASSIGMLMSITGVAVGFLMGALIVPNTKDYDHNVKNGIFELLVSQACISVILAIVSCIIVKNAPPTPPSKSQAFLNFKSKTTTPLALNKSDNGSEKGHQKQEEEEPNDEYSDDLKFPLLTNKTDQTKSQQVPTFKESLKMLVKNKQFLMLLQAYGLTFGVIAASSTVLNKLVTARYPNKEVAVGYMGFAAVLGGVISMLLSGFILDRKKIYKAISLAVTFTSGFFMVIWTVILYYKYDFRLLFFCYFVFGCASNAYVIIGLDHTAEIVYPIPDGTTSAILVMLGGIYGIIQIHIVDAVRFKGGYEIGGCIFALLYFVAAGLILLINAPLRRTEVDTSNSPAEDSRRYVTE